MTDMKKPNDDKAKEKRFVLITLIVSLVLMSCAFVYILTEVYIGTDEISSRIEAQLDDGNYENAYALMEKYSERILPDVMEEYKTECSYLEAQKTFGLGNIQKARSIFKELGEYADSKEMIAECDYISAYESVRPKAIIPGQRPRFLALAGYKNSDEKVTGMQILHSRRIPTLAGKYRRRILSLPCA